MVLSIHNTDLSNNEIQSEQRVQNLINNAREFQELVDNNQELNDILDNAVRDNPELNDIVNGVVDSFLNYINENVDLSNNIVTLDTSIVIDDNVLNPPQEEEN